VDYSLALVKDCRVVAWQTSLHGEAGERRELQWGLQSHALRRSTTRADLGIDESVWRDYEG
jgi:hypothetical protein